LMSGVQRPTAHSGASDPFEYRVYSWRQNFEEARRAAKKDLPPLGYRYEKTSFGWESWVKPSGEAIEMRGAKWTKPPEFLDRIWGGPGDPDWTTVLVYETAPDSWITEIRISLDRN
jgi:hypothetical protein